MNADRSILHSIDQMNTRQQIKQQNANLNAITEGAREYLADCYSAGYERGMRARLSGLYTYWAQCSDEHTFHGLYGFMDGFDGRQKII
jgi:hypothetical protein